MRTPSSSFCTLHFALCILHFARLSDQKRGILHFLPSRFLLAGVLLVQAGCAGNNLLNWNRQSFPQADERNPVRKVVCIWEPVQGQGLDGLPTRGFAGQIMFFTYGSASPVASDGDVRVYLFDDRGTPEDQARPIHQFDFQGQAWSKHLQDSTPGPSYRIFIPYVAKHPWQAKCGLRVRLTTPQGAAVYSEMVYVTLPGPTEKTPDSEANRQTQPTPVRPAPEISEFQLGATLTRSRRPLEGSGPVTQLSHQAPAVEHARSVEAPDDLEPAEPTAAAPPVRLTPTQQQADPLAGDEARIEQLEQMLQQLKQKKQHPLGAETAPAEPAEARRFRLSPAGSNGEARRTGRHPLSEAADKPHPLEEP